MAEIGSLLRETRMRERIDITTVESATKIRAKYLRALENEEWDQLPGPTFVRTFLRTYAEYLGLDPKMLVEDYKQRFERPAPQDLMPFASSRGGNRRPQRPPRVIPPWAIVGVCIVLLLVALFALGSFGDDSEPEVAATPTPAKTSTAKAGKKKAKPNKRAPVAAPKNVTLQILPEAEVNICLEDASGEPLIRSENLTEPSDIYRAKRMRVTFGNGQVKMKVGDKTYPVPDTDHAVGYTLLPGKEPASLPEDDLPTCA
jgi:cytoskeletal protein RodZ